MGKFDGILLCSDWDGTLYCDGDISSENTKAIRYFQENGGKFTICSGRYFEYLRQFEHLVHPNTYVACYNGGLVIDMDTGNVIHESFCDGYLFEIVDEVLKFGVPILSINIYDSESKAPRTFSVEEYRAELEGLKALKHYKILLRTDEPENGIKLYSLANQLELRDYIAVRSWNVSLEIMKLENAKGSAIRRIGAAIGARLTVGVGNFDNDIELIRAADIGYAVADSPDHIKKIADRIAPNSTDSAIARVIYEIERDFT